jgi:hypothetical protein
MPIIYTAQYRYGGPDRLDITVKGKHPIGRTFAPTWEMVMDVKSGRMSFEQYSRAYEQILLHIPAESWTWILSQFEITLVCFCRGPEYCHRRLLAEYLQSHFGCRYTGERIPQGRW